MHGDLIKHISLFLDRNLIENAAENDIFTAACAKLQNIINDAECYDIAQRKEIETAISSFIDGSEVQKNKLLSFCTQLYDPTEHKVTIGPNGEEVINHAFLKDDELMKLYRFVKRHASDSAFGGTVFQVMDNHGIMKPSEVYRNAMMSRQDFSRVTAPQCRSITRHIAWQIIIGLHCSLEEADEVLFSAGFIRRKDRFDLTMEYFIKQENYEIMAINEVLDELGLKPFSCYKSVKSMDSQ